MNFNKLINFFKNFFKDTKEIKKDNNYTIINPNIKFNLKDDLEYLLLLINDKINILDYKVKLHKIRVINDQDSLEYIETMTRDIINKLSEIYIDNVLVKYIPKKEIENFIGERVTIEVTKFVIRINSRVFDE